MITPDPFIKKLNEKHLCSWYILPLLGLSVETFGNSNFLNAFLIKDTYQIAVYVIDVNLCLATITSPFFKNELEINDREYLVFEIPEWWHEDYDMFLQGKYTKMSEEAKQKIRELCGLKYQVNNEVDVPITNAILLALDNHSILRKKWEDVLGTSAGNRPLDLPDELLSLPAKESFIVVEIV